MLVPLHFILYLHLRNSTQPHQTSTSTTGFSPLHSPLFSKQALSTNNQTKARSYPFFPPITPIFLFPSSRGSVPEVLAPLISSSSILFSVSLKRAPLHSFQIKPCSVGPALCVCWGEFGSSRLIRIGGIWETAGIAFLRHTGIAHNSRHNEREPWHSTVSIGSFSQEQNIFKHQEKVVQCLPCGK